MKTNTQLIYTLLVILFLCSCKDTEEESIESQISNLIKSEVNIDEEKKIGVILISEIDCSTCIDDFLVEYKENEVLGLYYSANKIKFKERLIKLNPNIEWKYLRDHKILNLLQELDRYKGPYYFRYTKDDTYQIDKRNTID